MATVQLNCRVEKQLAQRLREAATARHTTTGALVAQAIEALLAANSASPAPPPSALAALEARVAKLEAIASPDNIRINNNDESKGSNTTFIKLPNHDKVVKSHDNIRAFQENRKGYHDNVSSQGITTPELAIQTGTSKGAWNTWASKATIGDIRHHPQAGSWRLLGKAALASGGPPRWLWEAEG